MKTIGYFLMFASVAAQARGGSTDIGGGGQGLQVNGRYVMRDLSGAGCLWRTGSDVAASLSGLPKVMARLRDLDPIYAQLVSYEGRTLKFCFSGSALNPISAKDSDSGNITVYEEPKNLGQAAVRINEIVYVDQNIFEAMDDMNRAYLFVHEVMHSYLPSQIVGRNQKLRNFIYSLSLWVNGKVSRESLLLQIAENGVNWPSLAQAKKYTAFEKLVGELAQSGLSSPERTVQFFKSLEMANEIRRENSRLSFVDPELLKRVENMSREAFEKFWAAIDAEDEKTVQEMVGAGLPFKCSLFESYLSERSACLNDYDFLQGYTDKRKSSRMLRVLLDTGKFDPQEIEHFMAYAWDQMADRIKIGGTAEVRKRGEYFVDTFIEMNSSVNVHFNPSAAASMMQSMGKATKWHTREGQYYSEVPLDPRWLVDLGLRSRSLRGYQPHPDFWKTSEEVQVEAQSVEIPLEVKSPLELTREDISRRDREVMPKIDRMLHEKDWMKHTTIGQVIQALEKEYGVMVYQPHFVREWSGAFVKDPQDVMDHPEYFVLGRRWPTTETPSDAVSLKRKLMNDYLKKELDLEQEGYWKVDLRDGSDNMRYGILAYPQGLDWWKTAVEYPHETSSYYSSSKSYGFSEKAPKPRDDMEVTGQSSFLFWGESYDYHEKTRWGLNKNHTVSSMTVPLSQDDAVLKVLNVFRKSRLQALDAMLVLVNGAYLKKLPSSYVAYPEFDPKNPVPVPAIVLSLADMKTNGFGVRGISETELEALLQKEAPKIMVYNELLARHLVPTESDLEAYLNRYPQVTEALAKKLKDNSRQRVRAELMNTFITAGYYVALGIGIPTAVLGSMAIQAPGVAMMPLGLAGAPLAGLGALSPAAALSIAVAL